uniref:USP8_dimer domain-containing protein n=1 Tax=Heterorhabditis bacteriophora TaxID=37862 RepID=A0A1I7X7B4_HETBA
MVQDLDISKTNATERMRSLIASANSLKINSHVPLNRYYRSMIEMHRMAHLYLESNNFEKALVLLVRFCRLVFTCRNLFTIEQLPNHANYGLYDSEEKRNVLELLNPALEKAEEIKQQLRKIYDEEANEFNRLFLIHQKEQVGAGRTSRVLVEAGQLVPVDDTSLNTNHSAPISLPITNPDVSTVEILFSGLKVSPSSITASGPVATSVFLDNNKPSINSGGTILGQNAVKHSEKNMTIAGDLIEKFMQFTVENTSRNIETCGILCGKMVNDNFIVSHVIIPKQKGSANGCTAENEEEYYTIYIYIYIYIGKVSSESTLMKVSNSFTDLGFLNLFFSSVELALSYFEENNIIDDKPTSSKESSSFKTRNLKRKLAIVNDRPRRSVRNTCTKNYTEVRGSDSSSSDENSGSSHSEKDLVGSEMGDSDSDVVDPEKLEFENESLAEDEQKKGVKRHVKSSQKTSRCSDRASGRKDSNDAKNTKTKVSAPRSAVKTTVKPWQKANEGWTNGDIVVPPRTLSRGERKMLEFRIFADSLLVGRSVEMTMEEAVRIVEELKARITVKKKESHTILNLSQKLDKSNNVGQFIGSSSEDEWEEMEPLDEQVDNKALSLQVEVTINKVQEKDWWALYLRQEVNKRLRENWEYAHRVHVLCYITHLQHIVKTVLDENLVPSLLLTQIPDGYAKLFGQPMADKAALKLVKWFSSEFKCSLAKISSESLDYRFIETARFSTMVQNKMFETDSDRAAVLL